jgi:hypothetical protein
MKKLLVLFVLLAVLVGGVFAQSLGWTGFGGYWQMGVNPFIMTATDDGADPSFEARLYQSDRDNSYVAATTSFGDFVFSGNIFAVDSYSFTLTEASTGIAVSITGSQFKYVTVPLFDLFTVGVSGPAGGITYDALNGSNAWDGNPEVFWANEGPIYNNYGNYYVPNAFTLYGDWGVEGLDTFVFLDDTSGSTGNTVNAAVDVETFYNSLTLGAGYHLGDLWPRVQFSLKNEFVQAAVKVTAIEDLPFDVGVSYGWDALDPDYYLFTAAAILSYASGDFNAGTRLTFQASPSVTQFFGTLTAGYVFDTDKGYKVDGYLGLTLGNVKTVIDAYARITIPYGMVSVAPRLRVTYTKLVSGLGTFVFQIPVFVSVNF